MSMKVDPNSWAQDVTRSLNDVQRILDIQMRGMKSEIEALSELLDTTREMKKQVEMFQTWLWVMMASVAIGTLAIALYTTH